jgi:hypothetical protein
MVPVVLHPAKVVVINASKIPKMIAELRPFPIIPPLLIDWCFIT